MEEFIWYVMALTLRTLAARLQLLGLAPWLAALPAGGPGSDSVPFATAAPRRR